MYNQVVAVTKHMVSSRDGGTTVCSVLTESLDLPTVQRSERTTFRKPKLSPSSGGRNGGGPY
jgi:hypothetical protein